MPGQSTAQDNDISLMAHLMRRAGFGAARDELEERAAIGYAATVDELLDPDAFGVPKVEADILVRYLPSIHSLMSPSCCRSNWVYHMINTKRPLEEKIALLWQQVFATGNSKVDAPNELQVQLDLFREYGLGCFRDLLVEVARTRR